MQCINFRNFSTASNNLTVLAHTRSLLAQNVSQPVRTPEPLMHSASDITPPHLSPAPIPQSWQHPHSS